MAKTKTAHAYELELKKMIESRTGVAMEPWLMPQVRATAANMVILDLNRYRDPWERSQQLPIIFHSKRGRKPGGK